MWVYWEQIHIDFVEHQHQHRTHHNAGAQNLEIHERLKQKSLVIFAFSLIPTPTPRLSHLPLLSQTNTFQFLSGAVCSLSLPGLAPAVPQSNSLLPVDLAKCSLSFRCQLTCHPPLRCLFHPCCYLDRCGTSALITLPTGSFNICWTMSSLFPFGYLLHIPVPVTESEYHQFLKNEWMSDSIFS